MANWTDSKYFGSHEFDSPDAPGSGQNISQELLDKLNRARGYAGIPFKINSGFRTPVHNAAVGGKSKSAHLTGEAADIAARDPNTRFRILRALMELGFTRIEVTPWHVHVDVAKDDAHPQDILLILDDNGDLV